MQVMAQERRGTLDGNPPVRSLAQCMASLDRANDVRTFRAQVKRDIKAGRRTFSAVLLDEDRDPRLDTMKVFDLLLAAPKFGRGRASTALRKANVSLAKTLGGMTDRQRAQLMVVLQDEFPVCGRIL